MGHMDTLTFIRDKLFSYLPVLMSLFCVATFFKLGSKIVHYFGIEQFTISDEITQDLILQGQNLVKRESQKLTRLQTSQVVTVNARPSLNRQTSQDQLLGGGGSLDNSPDSPKTVYGVNKNLFDDI